MAYRPKPIVNPIVFIGVVAVIIVILFIAGFFTTKQCVNIGNCQACWNTISKDKASEACPSGQKCTVEPYVDQHNALTKALICACDQAKSGGDYPFTDINKRIQEVYKELYGADATVTAICEGGSLVKVGY